MKLAVKCLMLCPLLTLLVAGAAVQVQAQALNPLANDARAAYAGGALFRAQCATCHGADARGIASIDAPDLTQIWNSRQLTDADVFAAIRDGVPGTIMPPHEYTETELWMLVSYLRSVAQQGVVDLPAGDSSNGQRLFASQCAECHRVGNSGGVLGPDLTSLLVRRSLEDIRGAVRDPDVTITSGYDTVIVQTNSGETIPGVLSNIDAFSVQLVSRQQQLLAFRRQQLTSIEQPDSSLMPAFSAADLSENELLDVLNYIQSISSGVAQ